MEIVFQNWITALSAGIVAGSLIGLVVGHLMKTPESKALSSPAIFKSGWTSKVLAGIAIALIVFAFLGGILQGLAAIAVGYATEIVVGAKVNRNNHGAGYDIAAKTILIMGLVIVLPVALWGYHSYSRVPSEPDERAFVYDCTNYSLNGTFEHAKYGRPSKVAIIAHQEICAEVWRILVDEYRTMGKINNSTRDGGNFGLYNSEVREIYSSIKYKTP